MQITFVKKVLANGEPCAKCADVESRLRDTGRMADIDRVVVADERDPMSEGMRLAARHGVATAPFFLVEGASAARGNRMHPGDGGPAATVYRLPEVCPRGVPCPSGRRRASPEAARANPDLDLL